MYQYNKINDIKLKTNIQWSKLISKTKLSAIWLFTLQILTVVWFSWGFSKSCNLYIFFNVLNLYPVSTVLDRQKRVKKGETIDVDSLTKLVKVL